jgi:hypothetical protein
MGSAHNERRAPAGAKAIVGSKRARYFAVRAIASIVLLLAGPLAPGCGSGSSGITLREYARRANAVCLRVDRALSSLAAPVAEANVAPYLRRQLSLRRHELQQLTAIPLPSQNASEVGDWLRNGESLVQVIALEADAARGVPRHRHYVPRSGVKRDAIRLEAAERRYVHSATRIGVGACVGAHAQIHATTTGSSSSTASIP